MLPSGVIGLLFGPPATLLHKSGQVQAGRVMTFTSVKDITAGSERIRVSSARSGL
jgi:hypothetical protein